jgi:ATP-binding cassette subfamily B (MDR/TAP) protein 6
MDAGAAPSTSGSAPSVPLPGEDSGAQERTWISLFTEACVYVWPESFGLQLRAVGCLLLLVAMRVLNLAVRPPRGPRGCTTAHLPHTTRGGHARQ